MTTVAQEERAIAAAAYRRVRLFRAGMVGRPRLDDPELEQLLADAAQREERRLRFAARLSARFAKDLAE